MALSSDIINRLTDNKKLTRQISNLYYAIGERKKAEIVQNCCSEVYINDNGEFFRTYFCKDRFCQICSYRRSRYVYAKTLKIVQSLQNEYDFYMLTLTVPNCRREDFSDVYSNMTKAYTKFMNNHLLKGAFPFFVGSIRMFEVTINTKIYSNHYLTFHPHFHSLVAVPKGFVLPEDIKEQITSRWALCTGYNISDKAIDIRPILMDNEYELRKSLREISKYTFKCKSLNRIKDENERILTFALLYDTLNRKHKFNFRGIFKQFAQEFITDEEDLNFHFIQFTQNSFHLFSFNGKKYKYLITEDWIGECYIKSYYNNPLKPNIESEKMVC